MIPFTRNTWRVHTWAWIGAFVVPLTATLGLLQFRWLTELSDRERESQQSHLNADVLKFSEDFDRELTRAYFALQLDDDTIERRDGQAAAARRDLWAAQSAYPHLVRDIWVVEPADLASEKARRSSWRFLHLDLPLRRFVETPPPTVWREPEKNNLIASPLDEETLTMTIRAISLPHQSPGPVTQTGAVVTSAAVQRVTPLFVVVQLDRNCIVKEMLPALMQRYFGRAGAGAERRSEFQLAIVRTQAPRQVVWASNPDADGTLLVSVDATAPLFGIRVSIRKPTSMTRARAAIPVSSVAVMSAIPLTPVLSLSPAEYWQLRVAHRAGSLAAFAQQTRQRNLLMSLTILLALAGSLVLLLVAARRARALARQQIEFVAGISHELRTPIAVICMTGANLADGVISDPEGIRRYGSLIQQEGRRLTGMVEQVLSYARIEAAHRPVRTPVSINMLIQGAVHSLEPQIQALGFTCALNLAHSLPAVVVDRFSIECVIQNLLTNAIKYSAERRKIAVTTGDDRSHGEARVWIAVEDQGIGIPQEEQSLIFEPFHRGRGAIERSLPGTGLGLSLVRRIVQAHGGTVHLHSTPGNGSTFTVYLPAADTSKEPPRR